LNERGKGVLLPGEGAVEKLIISLKGGNFAAEVKKIITFPRVGRRMWFRF